MVIYRADQIKKTMHVGPAMNPIILEKDQTDSLNKVSEHMHNGCKAILLQGATGSGKSYIGSEIFRRARAKGRRGWFMVPRKNLIHQMHTTFDQFRIEHSYIASSMSMNPAAPAHICSMETLRRRLDRLKPPHLAVIDETHFGGEGLDATIAWLKENGTWIIGLSATPWTLSGEGLKCWYDEMVTGPSVRWLIDNKRLSDYRPFEPSTVDLSKLSIIGGDYAKGQLSQKMEQDNVLIGNAVKHYKENARGKRNIAYCVSIKHSQLVAASFNAEGVTAAHIDGTTPHDERRRIIKAFAKREIEVLTNCELLTFGFDLASQINLSGLDASTVTIESMSDLRPTKSLALQMQKWGRVLRKKNEPAVIFDHANNFREHGYPCDERHWTLEDRVKQKRNSVPTMPVRSCHKCYFCHRPTPTCPNCGYEYPIESRLPVQAEGELREVKIREKIRIADINKKKRMQIGMAKTLADLRGIAKSEGYHWRWIEKQAMLKGIDLTGANIEMEG